MKIEIWSDIMCPFCYIGKRQLETALEAFPGNDFEIEWKSFQLDPTITSQSGKDVYTFLAERKGISVEQSKEMHKGVVERAKSVGLDYHFDKAIISNSLTAHRIIHLAKAKKLGDEMEEIFFKAYFTNGKDLNDSQTLIELGIQAGLDSNEVKEVVENENLYLSDVKGDIKEAQEIGVQGVPFFVFDRKYAVSGAQPVEAFVNTIKKVQK
ncbi:protein disulfide-isomerase [Flavobacterium aquidurense]|uniref:Disulfide bond formation protein DsbA n=1 Tax=Flavobacterium frigidimaris TaxID=262320 RepID=A0ABX4BKN9_FLAFR|nr:DsbA family oxidoreductase [Flavobacterium frigidimaris]OXA75678.1 disulfide bond formation protein DsbA [Flavobacterium frigidimaris]SDZ65688.1 protein disulfide-isomerase [Flavobacterium aquidurense]